MYEAMNTAQLRHGYVCEVLHCPGGPLNARASHYDLSANRFACEHCARRAEVDDWLQQVGAVVVQVRDLPRALDANARGAREVERATRGEEQARSLTGKICGPILDAAHLARVALGEVS